MMSVGKYEEQYGLANEIVPYTEAEIVNTQTGELVPYTPPPAPASLMSEFVGISALPFDAKAQTTLARYQEVPDEWLDIRPDNGAVFLTHMKYRHILNEAFGFGGWAIMPVGDFKVEENGSHVILYREYRLFVNGRFVSDTTASGDYWKNNHALNYSDAAEICQSNAIVRLCKPLGIASQCWDRSYTEQWKRKYASQNGGKWQRKPFNTASTPAANSGRGTTPPAGPNETAAEPTSANGPASDPVVDMVQREFDAPPSDNTYVIQNVTEAKAKNGKPYWKVRTNKGGMLCWSKTVGTALVGLVGEPVALKVKVDGEYKTIEAIEE